MEHEPGAGKAGEQLSGLDGVHGKKGGLRVSSFFEKMQETVEKTMYRAVSDFPSCIEKVSEKLSDMKEEKMEKLKEDNPNFPYDEKGELLPDIRYESEGYRYQTDGKGRIVKAEGTLRLENGIRDENAQRRVGGEDRLPGDQGGHLIGRQFGGSGGLDNLAAMKGELNQGEYKKLEMDLRKALENGQTVDLTVTSRFRGDSKRPSAFVATCSIDGERTKKVFDNT